MINQFIPRESDEQCMPTSPISLDNNGNKKDATNHSTQILFDMRNIDSYKESLEVQTQQDSNAFVAQIPVETEDDIETVSSASYRALPTSLSLDRQSGTDFDDEDIEDIDMDYDYEPKKSQVHLPAMEIVIRNLGILQERSKAQGNNETKPKPDQRMNSSDTQDIDYNLETPIDAQLYNSSLNNLDKNIKDVPVNRLGPRDQEETGKYFDYALESHLIHIVIQMSQCERE